MPSRKVIGLRKSTPHTRSRRVKVRRSRHGSKRKIFGSLLKGIFNVIRGVFKIGTTSINVTYKAVIGGIKVAFKYPKTTLMMFIALWWYFKSIDDTESQRKIQRTLFNPDIPKHVQEQFLKSTKSSVLTREQAKQVKQQIKIAESYDRSNLNIYSNSLDEILQDKSQLSSLQTNYDISSNKFTYFNPNNLCYFNAARQMLRVFVNNNVQICNSLDINDILTYNKPIVADNYVEFSENILRKISNIYAKIKTNFIRDNFYNTSNSFRQQDSQEILNNLLNVFSDECKNLFRINQQIFYDTTKRKSTYEYMLTLNFIPDKVKNEDINLRNKIIDSNNDGEPYYKYTIKDEHDNIIDEKVHDKPNKYEGYLQTNISKITKYEFSEYIFIHVKLFTSEKMIKINNNHVTVLEKLKNKFDISNISSITLNTHNYSLISMICHIGNTLKGGHYVNYSKYNDTWYMYSDSEYTKIGLDFPTNLGKFSPYILLFKKDHNGSGAY